MTTETPKNACLLCGHKFEAASTPDGAALIAKPGDLAVCIQCGAVAKLSNDLTVEPLTEAEAAELAADSRTMGYLQGIVKAVHIIQGLHRARN